MSKNYKYIVLSPDGITIDFNHSYYTSKKKAIEAFNKWKERYVIQGYYSTNGMRIPLDVLHEYCTFKTI
jgi:hypothetical protein